MDPIAITAAVLTLICLVGWIYKDIVLPFREAAQPKEVVSDEVVENVYLTTLANVKTKQALIDVLVYIGFTLTETRECIKGDTATIGTMYHNAEMRIKPRMLKIDGKRIIPFNEIKEQIK